jgi:hypothetical protein
MVSRQLFEDEPPVMNTATNVAAPPELLDPPDLLDFTSPFVFPVHTPTPTVAVSSVPHAASGPTTGLFNLGVARTDAAVTPFSFASLAIAPMTAGVNVSFLPSSDDDMSE